MIDDDTARSPAGHLARRRRGRWWPWLVAAAILALLFWRTPLDELRRSVDRGPALVLAAYSWVAVVVAFAGDVWATRVGLRAVGIRLPLRDLVTVRGTTHLLGLINFTAGQGTIAYYLARLGTPAPQAAGGVLFLVLVSVVSLSLLGVLGLASAPPLGGDWNARLIALGLLAITGFFGILAFRPRWLVRIAWLQPLFTASRGGRLSAVASRFAHFLLFAVLYWGAIVVWGIPIPLGEALPLIVALMFVAALPITPYGIGTVQAAQIVLFSPYLAASERVSPEASILGFSLVHYAASMAAQAAVGLLCYLAWRRLAGRRAPTAGSPPPAQP